MKLSRIQKELGITLVVLVVLAGAVTIYLMEPLPPPNVSFEFQGYEPAKTRIFDLVAGTNEEGEFFYGSKDRTGSSPDWWFSCLPGSSKFSTRQTNVFCLLSLTNRGPTRIWWVPADCQVEAKTPDGWITNVFGHFTTTPSSVGSSRKRVFAVYVPANAIEWRITGIYEYDTRHSPRQEFWGWVLDDSDLWHKHSSQFLFDSMMPVDWILRIAPERRSETGQIFSDFFTNKPPINIP